ncbi:hypothetical protein FRC09_001061 [Ceratobasidium sp. 395]|nr:hypothetical protein FRC09_001061 [Ceratobasidium sp. 395]
MLVSRHFFYGILPHYWKRATMLDLFMRGLIPATQTRNERRIYVSISQTLTFENMARFHFYAPFIKMFSLNSFSASLRVEDWGPLITYSQEIELLPNLVVFEGWKPDLQPLSAFLSGSIRIIQLGSQYVSLTMDVLAFIATRCPAIHELEFYPGSTKPAANPTIEDIPQQTFAPMSEFRELRSLSTSTAVLQSHALHLVSQLPNLVDLEIKDGYLHADSNLLLSHALPANSFPSLRTLHVDLETFQDVEKFWDLIPLKMLSEVHISIRSPGSNDQIRFIPSLCRGSPQIRGLLLDFRGESVGDNAIEPVYTIQTDMFECLGNLPLDRFFSLTAARLDFENAWDRMAASLPRLGEIRCINQLASVDDLLMLSSNLPNLSIVECDFDLTHMASVVERDWQPCRDLPRYPKLKQLIIRPVELKELAFEDSPYDLYDLAKFFAYFWPNVDLSTSTAVDEDVGSGREDWVYENGLFNMFKKLIKSHAHSFRNV